MDGALCTGRGIAGECKYLEKCGAKTEFGLRDNRQPDTLSLYCMNRVGTCLRDDGGIKMSEAVREMTRDELIVEKAKLEEQCRILANRCDNKEYQIEEMQSHIDCLKAELAEIQMNNQKLPEEPIKAAEMLISASGKYTNMLGKEQDYRLYDKSELRQIAEHLLVHCNHAEVD